MRKQLIHRERDGVLRDKTEHAEPKAKDGDVHAGEGLVAVGGLLLVIRCHQFFRSFGAHFQTMGTGETS